MGNFSTMSISECQVTRLRMALLIRPLFNHQTLVFNQATICRNFSMATVLAGRKKNDKLDVPKDKHGIIFGKRKQAVYYPKVPLSS